MNLPIITKKTTADALALINKGFDMLVAIEESEVKKIEALDSQIESLAERRLDASCRRTEAGQMANKISDAMSEM